MEPISKHIILDLLPVYLSGEASPQTRKLVEEFARKDPEIAQMIEEQHLYPDSLMPTPGLSPDHEARTIKRIQRSIRKQMFFVALITMGILLIPLIAMQFTHEVNWSLFDFIIMGIMLSGAGGMIVFFSRFSSKTSYKLAVVITLLAGFLILWINLAVGIIGSEDNPLNLLYLLVYATGAVGAGISRLRPKGLSIALFATAAVQFSIPILAMFIGNHSLNDPSGLLGIVLLNSFFALMFVIAGFLFRKAAKKSGQ